MVCLGGCGHKEGRGTASQGPLGAPTPGGGQRASVHACGCCSLGKEAGPRPAREGSEEGWPWGEPALGAWRGGESREFPHKHTKHMPHGCWGHGPGCGAGPLGQAMANVGVEACTVGAGGPGLTRAGSSCGHRCFGGLVTTEMTRRGVG